MRKKHWIKILIYAIKYNFMVDGNNYLLKVLKINNSIQYIALHDLLYQFKISLYTLIT